MTIQELSKLYWLNREIQEDQSRLDEINREIERAEQKLREIEDQAVSLSAQVFDNTPIMASKTGSRVEDDAIVLADLKKHINAKKRIAESLQQTIRDKLVQSMAERDRLEQYISDIPDTTIRSIFSLRFVDGLTWPQVSDALGFRTTPDSVRMMCYRYLREEKNASV